MIKNKLQIVLVGTALMMLSPSLITAQSQFTLGIGPGIVSMDYAYSFAQESRQAGELGFIVNDHEQGEYFAFDEFTVYQFEALYHYSFIKNVNFDLAVGLGYRSSNANSEDYEYGFISIPLSAAYYFANSGFGLRARATNLIGDGDGYEFVPTLGLSYRF